MHESTKIDNSIFEFCKINIEDDCFLKNIQNCTDINILQSSLSNLFYTNTNVSKSTNITKAILKSIKQSKPDPNLFLKGISRHINNPLSPIYEHSIILTAAIFEDSSFNFSNFTQIEIFRDLMPSVCFEKKQETKLRSKFDSKIKIENDLSAFTRRDPINYLQEGIQIIKDENQLRLNEAFEKMQYLIENSSNRVIQFKCKEYFDVILSYDGFDLFKGDILCSLTNRAFDKLHTEIIHSIFGENICLRFKICLINVLIKIVQNESENINKIRTILYKIADKINEKETLTNNLILYNLKHLLEICQYKLK